MKIFNTPKFQTVICFFAFAFLFFHFVPFACSEQIKFTIPFDVDHNSHEISQEPVAFNGAISNGSNYLGVRELVGVAVQSIRSYINRGHVESEYLLQSDDCQKYIAYDLLNSTCGDQRSVFIHKFMINKGMSIVTPLSESGRYTKFKFYENKAKKYRRGIWA